MDLKKGKFLSVHLKTDDFSYELERTPCLSELDQWINDAFAPRKSSEDPPTSRQSEEPSTNTNENSATPSVSPEFAQTQDHATTTQDEGELNISIKYLFFFEEKKKQSTTTRPPTKRKGAPDGEIKFNGFKSDRGKMSIQWKNTNLSLMAFKNAAIDAIAEQDALELATHARELEDSGLLIWNVVIPHGGKFAANQKAALDSTEVFEDFLEEWAGDSDTRKFTLTLVQKDPKAAAQVRLISFHFF